MKFWIDEITRTVLKKFPHRVKDIVNSYDPKKIHAKTLLVDKIQYLQLRGNLPNPHISIIGGWYGNILIPLLNKHIDYKKIDFYEIDEEAIKIAKNYFFKGIDNINYKLQDATQVEFSGNSKLIINTSGEHMKPLNIKSGILAIQSNDYTIIKDHINCVKNVDELINQYKFKENKIWEKISTRYDTYNRFTVLGRI